MPYIMVLRTNAQKSPMSSSILAALLAVVLGNQSIQAVVPPRHEALGVTGFLMALEKLLQGLVMVMVMGWKNLSFCALRAKRD